MKKFKYTLLRENIIPLDGYFLISREDQSKYAPKMNCDYFYTDIVQRWQPVGNSPNFYSHYFYCRPNKFKNEIKI